VLAQRVVGFGREVVEVGLPFSLLGVGAELEKQVGVRAACGHDERALVFDDGGFHGQAAAYQPQPARYAQSLGVTVFQPDIEQG